MSEASAWKKPDPKHQSEPLGSSWDKVQEHQLAFFNQTEPFTAAHITFTSKMLTFKGPARVALWPQEKQLPILAPCLKTSLNGSLSKAVALLLLLLAFVQMGEAACSRQSLPPTGPHTQDCQANSSLPQSLMDAVKLFPWADVQVSSAHSTSP